MLRQRDNNMKIHELVCEDGRIVQGVNTTPDVKPGETKRQAAKFGNNVSSEGVPPLLTNSKNKSHTLHNLGLAESVLDVPTLSVEELASTHNVSVDQIKTQLKKGIKVEKEHTSDAVIAREIALDHLAEMPDYYDRLSDMEG